jgi:hypothetical protein
MLLYRGVAMLWKCEELAKYIGRFGATRNHMQAMFETSVSRIVSSKKQRYSLCTWQFDYRKYNGRGRQILYIGQWI